MAPLNLNQTTTVNLGIAATIVITGASLLWKVSQATSRFETALESSNQRSAALEESTKQLNLTVAQIAEDSRASTVQIKAILDDRFTMSRAVEVAFRNAMRNPGFKFSDPRDPTQEISVSLTK